MTEDRVVFMYITTSSENEAKKIAETLLKERLCACINIYPPVNSMYWWEGKIENSKEFIVLVKTRSSLIKNVEDVVTRLHSYTTPCIIAIPTEYVYQPFKNWVFEETQK